MTCFILVPSLVPRPRPAFRRLQYGKAVLIATESWAGPGNEATLFLGLCSASQEWKAKHGPEDTLQVGGSQLQA